MKTVACGLGMAHRGEIAHEEVDVNDTNDIHNHNPPNNKSAITVLFDVGE